MATALAAFLLPSLDIFLRRTGLALVNAVSDMEKNPEQTMSSAMNTM